jgi:oxygen-independent coproporphyrinogen-3 oxidase
MKTNQLGLYVHIPFCSAICHYCDFVKKQPKDDNQMDQYVIALIKEIELTKLKTTHVDTIYIGGGTPSMLTIKQLDDLFKSLSLYKPEEYTFEINPESYTHDQGLLLKQYGINRISLGVQTFNEKHLNKLNRKHSNQMVYEAIQDLKSLGFININVDLIYGLEHQTMDEFKDDLNHFLALDITHISSYSLIIEEKTYFHHLYLKGQFQTMNEDLEAEMYETLIETLTRHGYHHYEISNFSKPSFESKHNTLYWTLQPFIGLGLGAHGFDGKNRTFQTKSLSKYILGSHPTLEPQEEITLRNDHLLFLLRRTEGISLEMVKSLYHEDIFTLYPSLTEKMSYGLIEISNGYLHLTKKGLLLGNLVFMVFI